MMRWIKKALRRIRGIRSADQFEVRECSWGILYKDLESMQEFIIFVPPRTRPLRLSLSAIKIWYKDEPHIRSEGLSEKNKITLEMRREMIENTLALIDPKREMYVVKESAEFAAVYMTKRISININTSKK